MNKLKILWMMREPKYRWRYIYLLYYAMGCKNLPMRLSKMIAKKNIKEWNSKGLLPIVMKTYDGSCQAVHPDILMRDDGIWLVCTPYPYAIESYENPCVYHGQTIWGLQPVKNAPLAFQENFRKGNHISDPCIFGNHDKLYVLFRDTVNIAGDITQKLYICESCNGIEWSSKRLCMESKEKTYISPAVLKFSNIYLMYYIQLTTSNGGDIYKVSLDNNFEFLEEKYVKCHGVPQGMAIWHIGLTCDYNDGKEIPTNNTVQRLTGIFVLRDQVDIYKYALYWAHAETPESDWYIDEQIEIPEYIQREMVNVYKSALIPDTGDILLSYNDKSFRWCLCVIPGLKDRKNVSEHSFFDSYRVFTRVFSKDMKYHKFLYKHMDNPNRLENYYIQRKQGSQIIGTNCFMGAVGVKDNKRFVIAQSCDTAVVPEARGKGVFVNLIEEATKKLEEEKVDLMVGFPNNNSYHGFMKLGWKHIGNFIPLIKIVKPFDVVMGKVTHAKGTYGKISNDISEKLRLLGGMEKKISNKSPFSESDFEIINHDGRIKIFRSQEYFKWKFDNNNNFQYLTIRGEKLLAYAVYRVNENGRVLVADWFFDRCNSNVFNACIEQVCKDLSQVGNVIVMSMIQQGGDEERALRRNGFIDGNKKMFGYPTARMITYPLSDEGQVFGQDFKSWHVAPVDVDTIIT